MTLESAEVLVVWSQRELLRRIRFWARKSSRQGIEWARWEMNGRWIEEAQAAIRLGTLMFVREDGEDAFELLAGYRAGPSMDEAAEKLILSQSPDVREKFVQRNRIRVGIQPE
jgi:hypothetical protein